MGTREGIVIGTAVATSVGPHNTAGRWITFYPWGGRGSEKLTFFPKATQAGNVGACIQTLVCLTHSLPILPPDR